MFNHMNYFTWITVFFFFTQQKNLKIRYLSVFGRELVSKTVKPFSRSLNLNISQIYIKVYIKVRFDHAFMLSFTIFKQWDSLKNH